MTERPKGGIAWKELLPIVLACAVWRERWSRGVVTFNCDNTAAVEVVNSGYSRVAGIMHLLRCLFFIRARAQLYVWAIHAPGMDNGIADVISRDHLPHVFSQVSEVRGHKVHIPETLRALLVEQQPDWTSATWTRLFGSCFQLA